MSRMFWTDAERAEQDRALLYSRIKELEEWIKRETAEIERLRAENKALRDDLARISEEMGLPPTIGPAPGALKRIMALARGEAPERTAHEGTGDDLEVQTDQRRIR